MLRLEREESLQNLCLQRMCRDVVRHALNCQRNPSVYNVFQMVFADRFLEEVEDAEKTMEVIKERYYESCPTAYLACIKFLFNPFVKRIFICENMDINDHTVEVITANCSQNLESLILQIKKLKTASSFTLLKSMRNLVHLGLNFCSVDRVQTMMIISDFLVHLRYISFRGMTLKDEDLFVLCGHDCPLNDSISECSFSKNCSAKCKLLKLQAFDLKVYDLTSTGVACLLTHIPTLKYVTSTPSAEDVIYEIAEYRRERGIPAIQLSLENGRILKDGPKTLKTFLEACPVLRSLSFFIDNASDSIGIAKILEESELKSVRSFHVRCAGIDLIFNESFKNFWAKKGPQLRNLHLSPGPISGSEQDSLHFILHSCPAVSNLHLQFVATETEGVIFSNFPNYCFLRYLYLSLYGDSDFVNTFARNLIFRAPNLKKLQLSFPVNVEMLLPALSEGHLKHLRKFFLFRNDREETVKIAKLLEFAKRNIKLDRY